ncbi:hypothetical protein SLA2020_371420 [Shorea laevis]
MDLGFGREGFSEDEQMGKGKLIPFSNSSSSSSHHYKTQLIPLRWDQQPPPPPQMGSNWLGSKYCPDDDNDGAATATTANNEESRRGDSDSSAPDLRSASSHIEKEHMFDKVVTPSDVGKLNRLVIPKQHAEKYFPLDSSTNEKGLLLNFEDRNGKPWRFRYSYWNSSQSYVMTKGWSRYVKEKKLDAGDIVSFLRGVGEAGKDRLFIDWRRRPDAPDLTSFHPQQHFNFHRSIPWSPMLTRPAQILNRNSYYGGYAAVGGHVVNHGNSGGAIGSVYYLRSEGAAAAPHMNMGMGMGMGMGTGMEWQQHAGGVEPIVFESVPVVQGKAAAKRLRLFGVNMECPITESDDCEIISSTSIAAPQPVAPPHLASSSHHSPQLRLYNGTPLPQSEFLTSSKGNNSSSLDLDI